MFKDSRVYTEWKMGARNSNPVVFFSGTTSNFLRRFQRQIPTKRMNENEQVTVIIPIISNVTGFQKEFGKWH